MALRPGGGGAEIAVDERPPRLGVEIDLHHLFGFSEHGGALVAAQRGVGGDAGAGLGHRGGVGALRARPGHAGQRVIEPFAHPRRALMCEQIRLVEMEGVEQRREP